MSGAGAVAADERDDRVIRNDELSLLDRDLLAGGNSAGLVWHGVYFGNVARR